MTTTKTSKIAIGPLPNMRDPVIRRREQCISKLEDQVALLADANYVKVTQRYKGKGKDRVATEHRSIVRPWWSGVKDGVALRLRFIPGAQGFTVGSVKDLPDAIRAVIEQIKSGELDQMIAVKPKEKKAKPLNVPVKPPAGKVVAGKKRAA
jgi:hypothetical protein